MNDLIGRLKRAWTAFCQDDRSKQSAISTYAEPIVETRETKRQKTTSETSDYFKGYEDSNSFSPTPLGAIGISGSRVRIHNSCATSNKFVPIAADSQSHNHNSVQISEHKPNHNNVISPVPTLNKNNVAASSDELTNLDSDGSKGEYVDFNDWNGGWESDGDDNDCDNINTNNNRSGEDIEMQTSFSKFVLDDHISKLKSTSNAEVDVVLQKVGGTFGLSLNPHFHYARLCSIKDEHLLIGSPIIDDYFVTAVQGMSVLHLPSFESVIDKLKEVDYQVVAIRFQHKVGFYKKFQHAMEKKDQRTKKFTAKGISTLFRSTNSLSGSKVIALSSQQISAATNSARYSNVTVTGCPTNPIDVELNNTNRSSRILCVNNIPIALLHLRHLKKILANEGVTVAEMRDMDRVAAIKLMLDRGLDTMISSDDSILAIEKVPTFLAILGTHILSDIEYAKTIEISSYGVITVLDVTSFDTILKLVYGDDYDFKKFTKVRMILIFS